MMRLVEAAAQLLNLVVWGSRPKKTGYFMTSCKKGKEIALPKMTEVHSMTTKTVYQVLYVEATIVKSLVSGTMRRMIVVKNQLKFREKIFCVLSMEPVKICLYLIVKFI